MSFASPGRNDVLKRHIVDNGFDLEEVADAGLIKHIKLNLADTVGGSRHDFLFDGGGVVGKHDFAVGGGGGFAHFLLGVLEVTDADAVFDVHEFDLILRFGGESEDFAEAVIEALSETTSEFEMLELIFADGDVNGVVEEDVSSHEDGVVEDADIDIVLSLAFVFVLGHAVELAHAGDAVQNPAEFGVGGDARLAVEVDIRCKFETSSEVVFEGFDKVLLKFPIDVGDDRVEIGDEDVDLGFITMGVGEANHGKERTKKITESELTIDAKAGEDGGSFGRRIHGYIISYFVCIISPLGKGKYFPFLSLAYYIIAVRLEKLLSNP